MAAVYKSLARSSSAKAPTQNGVTKKNKQRVLILSSRGVTYRHRHLLNDLYSLLPHSRKDVKLDTKTKLYQLNELAELYNCNNVLFFEARKGKDLYIWMSKAPNGPTVKMHLQNCTRLSIRHQGMRANKYTQYIQCPNSTSLATVSKAPGPYSPLTQPSLLNHTSSSSKNSSPISSESLKARERQNPSSTTSWVLQ